MNHETAKQIVSLLNDRAPMTRGEMVPLLGLARTTIFDTLTVLVQDQEIVATKAQTGRKGRPKVLYSLPGGS